MSATVGSLEEDRDNNVLNNKITFKNKTKNCYFTDRTLWWADQNLGQLGTCNKKDGRNPTVLRNKTSGVINMKVYDKAAQQGKLYYLLFLTIAGC